MKTILKTLLVLLCLSATVHAAKPAKSPAAGVYGICNCSQDAYTSALVQLKLNNNNTFTYSDHTRGNASFDISGTWEIKGKYIVLSTADGSHTYHWRWKASGNNCIKSRKGLFFTRLCMIEGC